MTLMPCYFSPTREKDFYAGHFDLVLPQDTKWFPLLPSVLLPSVLWQ